MEIPMIRMDPELAQQKLQAYQQQLKRRADDEYKQAVTGYQALAAGTALISLTTVFEQTGLGADRRPRLAIARADRRQVRVIVNYTGLSFDTQLYPRYGYEGSLRIDIPFESKGHVIGYALVPMVPADVRPKGHLSNYFTLWEVEQWADRRIQAAADRDPLLLTHLAGDLYGVIAEWDLTELERAIMIGRR